MKKIIALFLAALMIFSVFTACGKDETTGNESKTAALTDFSDTTLFEQVTPVDEAVDFNDYYNSLGVDCDMGIRSKGGSVKWLGGSKVPLPTPSKTYTIAFSDYYTVDEVGAMYMEGMKQAAAEIGIELKVQDADYDQNLQNQAIEQWILEGVDAVILTPCDFYACKDGLNRCMRQVFLSSRSMHLPVPVKSMPASSTMRSNKAARRATHCVNICWQTAAI